MNQTDPFMFSWPLVVMFMFLAVLTAILVFTALRKRREDLGDSPGGARRT
jgi:hypothetical protein